MKHYATYLLILIINLAAYGQQLSLEEQAALDACATSQDPLDCIARTNLASAARIKAKHGVQSDVYLNCLQEAAVAKLAQDSLHPAFILFTKLEVLRDLHHPAEFAERQAMAYATATRFRDKGNIDYALLFEKRYDIPAIKAAASLEEILPVLETALSPEGRIKYLGGSMTYFEYYGNLYVRYLELALAETGGNHEKFDLILEKAEKGNLFLGSFMHHQEAQKIWFGEQYRKWKSLLNQRIAANKGKNTLGYVHVKEEDAKIALANRDYVAAMEHFLEGFRVLRKLPDNDGHDKTILLGTGYLIMTEIPAHPLTQQFKRDYSEEIATLPLGILHEAQMGMIDLDKISYEERVVIQNSIPTILYPNALDSADTNPQAAARLATYYQERLNSAFLTDCVQAGEAELLNTFRQDEDALVAFVATNHHDDAQLAGQLLNYAIRQRDLLLQMEARRHIETRLFSEPPYQEKYEEWERLSTGYQEAFNNDEYARSAELLAEANAIMNECCQLANESWSPTPLTTWPKVQQSLRPDEALVTIHRYLDRKNGAWFNEVNYGATVLRAGTSAPVYVPLAGGDSLEYEFFEAYLRDLQSARTDGSGTPFWTPIEVALGGANKVYLVPEGIYNRINPATLSTTAGQHLLDQYDVITLVNPAALTWRNDDDLNVTSALLLGNPAFDPSDTTTVIPDENELFRSRTEGGKQVLKWSRLPYSQQEVEQCQTAMQSAGLNTTLLTGKDASEPELFAHDRSPGILHLATHAYFSPHMIKGISFNRVNLLNPSHYKKSSRDEYPYIASLMRDGLGRYSRRDSLEWQAYLDLRNYTRDDGRVSLPETTVEELKEARTAFGLVLAGANRPTPTMDGILTRREITRLDLSATKLVVLSACNSGKADLIDGSGINGLRSTFQAAGVPYVINSLWPVRDDIAQRFMRDFYRHWLTDRQPIEVAFRNTQLKMANTGSSPYLWGGLMLVKL